MRALLVLLLQSAGWTSTPLRPTIGDTIWLTRTVAVPAGWRVRAGRLEPSSDVEPLADPLVARTPGGWSVRYPVVAWRPGPHTVALPPIWRLGPGGEADSLAGGAAGFPVRAVLPDSGPRPAPRPAFSPLRSAGRSVWPPLAAVLAASGTLAVGIWWRRRPPRTAPASPAPPRDVEVPDARWIAAGEPKAVAARATHRLRLALAAAVPAAHEALATGECLAVVAREVPQAPLRELQEVLEGLDQVGYATAHGLDVAALAERARRLAAEVVS